jgi:magnesium transporter
MQFFEYPDFTWICIFRSSLNQHLPALQESLMAREGAQLLDLHISDLSNEHLVSHFDYTTKYDLLVIRRLGLGQATAGHLTLALETFALGFVLFNRTLVTVHPDGCGVREFFVQRHQSLHPARVPQHPADLMLRMVNHVVDAYLDLRRDLTASLAPWQSALLNPKKRFSDWDALLQARMRLHHLDDTCEDQHAAMLEWLDALETWNDIDEKSHELLRVKTRDVLEHIARVSSHVRKLEQSMETAIELQLSIQSNRTNDIMRTLTALTAVFLPLNFITGFFGMNFDFLPWIHQRDGLLWALCGMVGVSGVLLLIFLRKRYLSRTNR